MKEFVQTIKINKPVNKVFEFAINPENTPKWVEAVVKEETNERPTKLGTIYRNQDADGNWAEFEITDFEEGKMFEMTKRDDNHHVKYTFMPEGDATLLEYCVWVSEGVLSDRFGEENVKNILTSFKTVIEAC